MPKGAAMIFNPGNGDYSGFRIVVEPDGHAMAVDAAGRATDELRSDVAQRFFDDLAAAAGSEQSADKSCSSAPELATTTVQVNAAASIAWNGRHWSDLSCATDARVSKLSTDAKAIEQALYVQAYRERTIVVYVGNSGGYAAPAYQQPGGGYSGYYGGPFNAGGFSMQPFSTWRVSSNPYSGYPSGSLPGGGLPGASLGGGLPGASLPTSNPYSGLPSASLSSSSPYTGSPYGSSPYSGGP
jgi:hypothetical protein